MAKVWEDGRWRMEYEVRLHGSMIMMRAVRELAVCANKATSSQIQMCRGDRITLDQDCKAEKLAFKHRSVMAIAHVKIDLPVNHKLAINHQYIQDPICFTPYSFMELIWSIVKFFIMIFHSQISITARMRCLW